MTNKKGGDDYVIENGEARKLQHNDFIELTGAYIKNDSYAPPRLLNEDGPPVVSRSHVEYFNMRILIDDIASIKAFTKYVGPIATGTDVYRLAFIFEKYSSAQEDSGVYTQSVVTLKKNSHYTGTDTTKKLYVLETPDEVASKIRAAKGQKATNKDVPEPQETSMHKEKELDVLHDLAERMERLEKAILTASAPKKRNTKTTPGSK